MHKLTLLRRITIDLVGLPPTRVQLHEFLAAADEIGFHALELGHYLTDMHATVLHQMGLHPKQLDIPGRQRLETDHGQVITDILA